MPPWSDKLVAEVVRMLLDAYYDVRFSAHSHGFRPGLGCHTALAEVQRTWSGTHWFIEGDIADCFGSFDHSVMLSALAEHIRDGRFLQLIERMLKAGYLEDWRWHATLSGAPQGGIASPVMSNVYLDRLDRFVEQELIPEYTRGERRRRNRAYTRAGRQIAAAERAGDREAARALRRRRRVLPSGEPRDPGYRRLRYVRYADDVLLGFAGPRAEAEEIKERLRQFLDEELKLELSESKTLITHAASQAARFLGYQIRTQYEDTKITAGQRSVNGVVGLFVPEDAIRKRCEGYMRAGEPAARAGMMFDTDFTVIAQYGAEYRGYVQYYLPAQDVYRLGVLRWVMETSMLKTLAAKHKSTVTAMARKYKAVIDTPHGLRTCFQVSVQREGKDPLVARFGGIPLKRQTTAVINDRRPPRMTGNELIKRILAGQCERCQAQTDLHVHHVRRLADLEKPGQPERPDWIRLMAQRKRKTLVVCRQCHQDIHAGRAIATTRK